MFDHRQYVLGVGHDDFKDIGAIVGDHLLDCRAEILALDNAPTGYAEALGDFDEIRIDGVDIVGATDVVFVAKNRLAAHAFVEEVFPLHNHTEVLVIEDDRLGVDLFDLRCGELLDIHHEAAIAVDIDDQFFRKSHLCANRSRQAEAHRAEAERADVGARLTELEELGRPHLVLADARCDDRVALRDFVESFNRFLLGDMARLIVAERVLFFPSLDGGVPFTNIGLLEFPCLNQLVQAGECVFDVRVDREVHTFVFVVLRSIDVDVYDLCLRCELGNEPGNTVVETCTSADQHIAIADRPVACHGAVHAEPVERLRVLRVEGTQAHQGGSHG